MRSLVLLCTANCLTAACSASATQTIENAGDASAIATCTTYSGNIAVATGMTDDLSLGTLEQISGDLRIEKNSNIKRVDGSGLKKITGELRLNDDSQIAALSFPKLTEVKTLTLTGLASLRNLNLDAEVTKCEKLDIQNTQLQDLKGINLEQAKTIIIANNPSIANISMKLTNITGALDLSFNNADVTVAFPKLESAQNISVRAVGNLSLPALSEVTPGSFGIFSSKMESFYAPNLTTVKEALTIVDNNQMKDLSFASLTDVGASFLIENNTALGEVTKLPKLKNVGAALDISGNLTKVESPSLDFVKGVFNLQSTADLGDSCTFYNGLKDKKKVPNNKYKCEGKLTQAGTAGTSSGSKDGSKPSSAASPLNAQNTYVGLAGLLAVFFL
ncbi:hypothetical protein CC80DRAFT_516945 [Byssothecium circinans]|uniref:GPI-anchored cell wall organization protein Ecm33 n=1 Tax=Byssothecium circinans TaxID=147558 RepID=A0A6A5TUS7_9PLEO|nr:hypothetical protein CC80DRAFT_516945 [Byssothecium circinans]